MTLTLRLKGKFEMSIDDLQSLAGKLRELRENRLKRGFVEPNTEAKLLAEAFLQAVNKIADLERRVAVLEGKPIDEEFVTHSLR